VEEQEERKHLTERWYCSRRFSDHNKLDGIDGDDNDIPIEENVLVPIMIDESVPVKKKSRELNANNRHTPFSKEDRITIFRLKGNKCARCDTVQDHSFLQIDYIDGNRMNNMLSNLQLLCSACYRGLKHPNSTSGKLAR
jgi:hypothetical protein